MERKNYERKRVGESYLRKREREALLYINRLSSAWQFLMLAAKYSLPAGRSEKFVVVGSFNQEFTGGLALRLVMMALVVKHLLSDRASWI